MSRETGEIPLSPAALRRVLAVLAVLLIVASVVGQIAKLGVEHDSVKRLARLVDVDAEQNIPTYFSVLLLLTAAFLLTVTAVLEARAAHPWWQWGLLALGFTFIGYDEAFQVHERLIAPMRRVLGGGRLGLLHYAWVVPGVVVVFLLMLVFLKFLVGLPAATRRRFVLAAALYVGGSIGMEMVSGLSFERHGRNNWQYRAIVTTEEALELAGLIAFIWALLRRWADNGTAIVVRFSKA